MVVALVGTREKEIENKILALERRKITGGDRMSTTKETTTEINLIEKTLFLSPVFTELQFNFLYYDQRLDLKQQ